MSLEWISEIPSCYSNFNSMVADVVSIWVVCWHPVSYSPKCRFMYIHARVHENAMYICVDIRKAICSVYIYRDTEKQPMYNAMFETCGMCRW